MLSSCFHLAFIGPGGPELLVIMLVLILVFGAKDAPKIFRKINEMLNSVRNTADSFKREIMYGDVNNESSSDDDTYSADADDYDYDADHDDDYDYGDEGEERDYSDETFQNLEKDLEEASAEPVVEEVSSDPVEQAIPASDEEEDHAEKA
jgi:sec-independent protein translocase protein TatA